MKYEWEPSRKGWCIKRCLWKVPERNSGDIYSSEKEHERWLGRKVRGHNTHRGKEGRGGAARLQTLSAARLCTCTLGHTGSACARPLQASPGQSCSQVRVHSFVRTSTNAQKRHLEAVANQSCWCGIAVQLGLIKEGWVGLLEHINMDVHVLMKPTGSSWEYTRKKKRFFTWATCLESVACLI